MERCAVVTVETISLANGTLTFSGLTVGSGPVVLLLHGFPDSPATFSWQIKALAEAGYQAVAMSMRGYETSSQPVDGDYHAIRMAEDVVAWISQLGHTSVHLIGHDWGANIAYATAALAPDILRSLTTLAVPHPVRFGEAYAASQDQQRRSAYILEFLAPGFEDVIVANDCAYLKDLWRTWSPGWDAPPSLFDEVRDVFGRPGVAKAALEYYRQGLDSVSIAGQQTAELLTQPIQVPTLGICGKDDDCIPPDIFTNAMRPDDFPVELQVECVAAAGHFLHCERPDEVNRLILRWLSSH
jgi:pimeloyl-ACP methyl ester carboxylesterase